MKYAIGIIQRVYEETTIYVEADSPEGAEEKALACAADGRVSEWRFLECDADYPYDIVSVTADVEA